MTEMLQCHRAVTLQTGCSRKRLKKNAGPDRGRNDRTCAPTRVHRQPATPWVARRIPVTTHWVLAARRPSTSIWTEGPSSADRGIPNNPGNLLSPINVPDPDLENGELNAEDPLLPGFESPAANDLCNPGSPGSGSSGMPEDPHPGLGGPHN